jgi:hypothetical protein
MIDRPSTSSSSSSGKDLTGGKPRSIADLHGLDQAGGSVDDLPTGPVIHDVTELLRSSSDHVAVLADDGYHQNVSSDAGHAVQVRWTTFFLPDSEVHSITVSVIND